MKHRFVRRVSALALAGCLLAGSSLPAFAAASTAKEEVIYANLTASGAVTGVYAVNSFSVQAGDTIADHGSYTAVRNMTTSDAVEQSGDTVTVHVTEDGKLVVGDVFLETTLNNLRASGGRIAISVYDARNLEGYPILLDEASS